MRLFVGLSLSEEARQEMDRLTLRLCAAEDGLRWASPEQWHITLVFAGLAEPAEHTRLGRELEKIRMAAVPVRIDGLGMFERVGVLYAAVVVAPELQRLQQAVAEAVRACGLGCGRAAVPAAYYAGA